MGFALHLDNLSRRVIRPALGEGRWHGWHGFRRGLASNLCALGIAPKVIQSILRQANVETTQTHYIIVNDEQNRAAMDELSKLAREKLDAA